MASSTAASTSSATDWSDLVGVGRADRHQRHSAIRDQSRDLLDLQSNAVLVMKNQINESMGRGHDT